MRWIKESPFVVDSVEPWTAKTYYAYLKEKFPFWKSQKYRDAFDRRLAFYDSYGATVMTKSDEKLRDRTTEGPWDIAEDGSMWIKLHTFLCKRRLIVMWDYMDTIELGCFFYPYKGAVVDQLYSRDLVPGPEWTIPWKESKGIAWCILYTVEFDQEQLSQIMDCFAETTKKCILYLIYSDDGLVLINDGTNKRAVPMDITQCDVSCRGQAQSAVVSTYRQSGMSESVAQKRMELTRGKRKAVIRLNKHLKMMLRYLQKEPATPTGIPDTAMTATIIHYLVAREVIEQITNEGKFTVERLLHDVPKIYAQAGFEIGVLVALEITHASFLGGWWSHAEQGGYVWHPITPGKLCFVGRRAKDIFGGWNAKKQLYYAFSSSCQEFRVEPIGSLLLSLYDVWSDGLTEQQQEQARAYGNSVRPYRLWDVDRTTTHRVVDIPKYLAKVDSLCGGGFSQAYAEFNQVITQMKLETQADKLVAAEAITILNRMRFL